MGGGEGKGGKERSTRGQMHKGRDSKGEGLCIFRREKKNSSEKKSLVKRKDTATRLSGGEGRKKRGKRPGICSVVPEVHGKRKDRNKRRREREPWRMGQKTREEEKKMGKSEIKRVFWEEEGGRGEKPKRWVVDLRSKKGEESCDQPQGA